MKAVSSHSRLLYDHTNIIISDSDIISEECKENLKHIHLAITSQYLSSRKKNYWHRTLCHSFIGATVTMSHVYKTGPAQNQQIPLLQSYLHKINFGTYIQQCPLCLTLKISRIVNFADIRIVGYPQNICIRMWIICMQIFSKL